MPPDLGSIEMARVWLLRAKSNLARAKQPKVAEVFWEDLCFDAQQAAEKAIKAVLVYHQIDFPRTHQIAELLVILRQAGHTAPETIWEAHALTNYAVVTRYPGASEPVTEEEYLRAVGIADQVVRWAEGIVHGG